MLTRSRVTVITGLRNFWHDLNTFCVISHFLALKVHEITKTKILISEFLKNKKV